MASEKTIKKSITRFAQAAAKNYVSAKRVKAADYAAANPAPVDVRPSATEITEAASIVSPDYVDRSQSDGSDYTRLLQPSAPALDPDSGARLPRVAAHEAAHRGLAVGILRGAGLGVAPPVDPLRGVPGSAENFHQAAAAIVASAVTPRNR